MAGKKRSGLANDRRGYGCSRHCPITQWTPVVPTTYIVIYFGNGNTGGTPPVDGLSPYNPGSTVTILGNTGSLVRISPYVFSGWNTAANGSGTSYSPTNTFIINANTSLYAQWIDVQPTYTLTYDGNGNTGGTPPVDGLSPYNSGSTVTILGNTGTLVQSGSAFDNWNTQSDGSGTSYLPGNTFTINVNTILYAVWLPL